MGKPAPRPVNLDAMTAAYASGDQFQIARELAVYDEQLVQAGLEPSRQYLEAPDLSEPTRGEK